MRGMARVPANTPSSAAGSSLAAKDGARRMVEDLHQAIESGVLGFGDRLQPLRAMAKHYGISMPTAQRGIVGLERRGMVRRRHGSGVFVTYRAPAAEEGTSVVMLLSHHDPVFDRFAARLSEGLTHQGLQPVRPAWGQAEMEATIHAWLSAWRAQPPRAVVMQRALPQLAESVERLSGGRSLVTEVFHVPASRTPHHRINPDYAGACHLAVQHFLARGHQRLGFVTHRRRVDPASSTRTQKRTVGHTHQILEMGRALREAGIRRHGLTLFYNQPVKGRTHNTALHPDNVERAMRWLSSPNRPTAVFGDDNRIAAVVRAAERLGMRIGEDLDVLGQGNTDWAEALNFPSIEMSPELVADEVLELIGRSESGALTSRHEIAVPVHLVQR